MDGCRPQARVSLDGYIAGLDGGFAWSAPDGDVFRFATHEVRGLGVHLLGRRLYETMSYWETVHQASRSDLEREFAAPWTSLPKVVFSKTLTSVEDGYRLAAGSLAEEVERWRASPGRGDVGIGGATLAAEALALDLIESTGCASTPCSSAAAPRSSRVLDGARTSTSSTAARSARVSCNSATACGADAQECRYWYPSLPAQCRPRHDG